MQMLAVFSSIVARVENYRMEFSFNFWWGTDLFLYVNPMSLNIRWFFSLIQMILLYFILFSDFSGAVLVADGVEHIFMCLLIIYMCVCVYTHICVCEVPIQIFAQSFVELSVNY